MLYNYSQIGIEKRDQVLTKCLRNEDKASIVALSSPFGPEENPETC